MEVLIKQSKNIVLVGDIGGDALRMVVNNKMNGIVNALIVDVPYHGEFKRDYYNDISVLVGSKIISNEVGLSPEQFVSQFNLGWVGKAKTVISSKKETVIVPEVRSKALGNRIKDIKSRITNEESIFEKEKLEERLAKLTTGVAVIKVGAKTSVAVKEKVERVKDAIGACTSAIEEGIVPGGGTSYLRLAKIMGGEKQNKGEELIMTTLLEPTMKLLENAGASTKNLSTTNAADGKGYDVKSDKIVDMIDNGIIDPAKVIRLSIENAISVAGSVLCTDCLIVDIKDKEEE